MKKQYSYLVSQFFLMYESGYSFVSEIVEDLGILSILSLTQV